MSDTSTLLTVHVNVEVTAATLETIVNNVKQLAGKDAGGRYRVDPADNVSELISRFLAEKGFEEWVRDIDNY